MRCRIPSSDILAAYRLLADEFVAIEEPPCCSLGTVTIWPPRPKYKPQTRVKYWQQVTWLFQLAPAPRPVRQMPSEYEPHLHNSTFDIMN